MPALQCVSCPFLLCLSVALSLAYTEILLFHSAVSFKRVHISYVILDIFKYFCWVLLETCRPGWYFDQLVEVASYFVLVGRVLLPTREANGNRTQPFVIAASMAPKLEPLCVLYRNTEYRTLTRKPVVLALLGCWTSCRPTFHFNGCFCANYSNHLAIAMSLQATRIALAPSFCVLPPGSVSFSCRLCLVRSTFHCESRLRFVPDGNFSTYHFRHDGRGGCV